MFTLFISRESLYEDEEFDQRQLAALLVSKVWPIFIFFCHNIATKFFYKDEYAYLLA